MSDELSSADLEELRALWVASWPDEEFDQDDVDHAMGGVHWLAEADGRIVGHVSVVPRVLEVDGLPLSTGYVEAVATHDDYRHRGIATQLMTEAGEHIREAYELGALATDVYPLYEGTGWERWRGPTWIRTDAGLQRSEEADDAIMILRTPSTPPIAGTEALSCDPRPGDDW
jgi:aminoglycoside 2'-N-acetyltransferase I